MEDQGLTLSDFTPELTNLQRRRLVAELEKYSAQSNNPTGKQSAKVVRPEIAKSKSIALRPLVTFAQDRFRYG